MALVWNIGENYGAALIFRRDHPCCCIAQNYTPRTEASPTPDSFTILQVRVIVVRSMALITPEEF